MAQVPTDPVVVDIIIPTYRRGEKISATLASICANSYRNFILWVIDQSEDDATRCCVERHAAEDARIRYIHSTLNGSGPKKNAAVTLGAAPYILFTNDDCLVASNWIAQLVAELHDEHTWMVFGKVLPGDPATCGMAETTGKMVLALNDWPHREVYEGNRFNLRFGQGHNMGVQRCRFEQLGGFDELLGSTGTLGSWEDRDIGYRLLVSGGRIVYTPTAVIRHCHWQDWTGVRRSFRGYGIGTGSTAAKFMRCGDLAAFYLIIEWIMGQGLRQFLSGVIKHHSQERALIGLMQMVYPWVGFFKGLSYPINKKKRLFQQPARMQGSSGPLHHGTHL